MDASSASSADPAHIPNRCIPLTIGIVPKMVIAILQIDLRNRRGGDNYALA
jgi:hypothetical protein